MSHQLLLSTSGTHTESTIPSSLVANNLTGTNTQETSGSLITNTYIAPIGNTTTSSLSSASALSPNTWGFALASTTPGIVTNNFNTASEYTSTDQSIQNTNKYASVPTSGNEVLLTQDTTGTSNTTIYYGVLADRDIPAGSYGNTVLYTALAEQPSEIRVVANNTMDPAVIDLSSPYQTMTIYTSINTTAADLGTATVKFIDSNGEYTTDSCTNVALAIDSSNYLYATCTSPTLLAGSYDVELTLDSFGRVLTGSNDITYTGTSPMQQITTMQQMTTSICQNSPIGTTMRLRDTRGRGNAGGAADATYGVIRAKDGNCWMTENFDLYNKSGLTNADTDIPSGNFTIPDTSNWSYYDALAPYVRRATTSGYTNVVYYNWCSAIASASICSDVVSAAVAYEANQSICPRNWKLPNSLQWSSLMNSYDVNKGSQLLDPADPSYVLGFRQYSGVWNSYSKVESDVGVFGLYTTSRYVGASSRIYAFRYLQDERSSYNEDWGYWDGMTMRCVAR